MLILRHIYVYTAAMRKQEALHIMGVCLYTCLSYPAYKSHLLCAALYCHLWPAWLYHIFHTGTTFKK